METFKQILDSSDNFLYGDIPSELQYLTNNNIGASSKLEAVLRGKKQKVRLGFKSNKNGSIYIITTEDKYIKSSKLFRELMNMSEISLNTIVGFNNKQSLNQDEYIQGLIHNLTSLNTYNIQDLYSLVPQNILSKNINNQKNVIKDIISKKPNVTVNTLLKLIKYNFAMKVEFSVFEKTVMANPNVQKIEYSIREIILSILQIFIEDFEERKIDVKVEASEKRVYVDYDTLFVSLYYIFDNAVKYCSKNSVFKIKFNEENDLFFIIFDMLSLNIEEDEVTKICNKRFRAKSAKNLTGEGKGIGMNRVLKTLRLNNAELEIIPRVSSFSKTYGNIEYEHNQFIIKLDTKRII